jgi:glycosyl transferase family 25
MDQIDALFYINLAHRTDRRELIESMLSELGVPSEKIIRIEAVYMPENGAHGCIKSHIHALQTFLTNPAFQTGVVLEDDFCFSSLAETVKARFNSLFSSSLDWEIISLAYNPNGAGLSPSPVEGFLKVVRHGTTSGYLLRRSFVPTLLENFQESDRLMMEHGRKHFCCLDVHWNSLQPISKWYAFSPALGFQREGYSDIEKAHVNYKC